MFFPVWYVSCIIWSFPSQIFISENTDPGCLQGIFQTCDELDKYEKMWHTCIYQPSWSELKREVREYKCMCTMKSLCWCLEILYLLQFDKYSQLWLDKLFIDIRWSDPIHHCNICDMPWEFLFAGILGCSTHTFPLSKSSPTVFWALRTFTTIPRVVISTC